MPTIVSIELGGTGANTAAGARAALGAASAVDSNSSNHNNVNICFYSEYII